ncbi:hypothetical protein [Pinibacter aurantiacus]|uniref:TerB family tellurite resistance protein n=1 Tax=Pinibacter aurantiacus TaxID=2851599 RepID=A0A9E2W7V0_9BACT|nr:hypothetical protein [Pinibacter aurantiacus]MBV4357316.1 hypothetical protein [Pinibacter aurantiacus]
MKKVWMFFLIVLFSIKSNAQNQQIKVYLQQIAANKAYIELLQKGYQIVKQGWKTIGDIKQAHFTLDGDFFKSLESINPKIKNYAKTVGGFVLLNAAREEMDNLRVNVASNSLFSENEKAYVDQAASNVKGNCTLQSSFLQSLITASELKMSDDERIKRIDEVFMEAQDLYSFSRSFKTDVQLLVLQKQKEQKDVDHFKQVIDVK